MTIPLRAVRDRAADELAAAGVGDLDAELIIAHVLGVSRGELQAAIAVGREASDAEVARVGELVARRARREPLQHLTGRAPFRRVELAVGPGVFVPRPETELLVELAMGALLSAAEPEPVAVDLGTGSGAIAISLALEVPHARVHAVELSPEAHAWAERNIAESRAEVSLVLGDLASALPQLDGTVAVVVSNPPYIPVDAVPRDPEVHLYDPELALYGGEDGLDVVRALSTRARALLRPGGTLALEHGEVQGAAIRALLTADGWRGPATHPDFLGRDRMTSAVR